MANTRYRRVVHMFTEILLEKERRKGNGKRHFKLANGRLEINHDVAVRAGPAAMHPGRARGKPRKGLALSPEPARRGNKAGSSQVLAETPPA